VSLRQPPRRTGNAATCALAAVLAAGQVAGSAHLLLVRHSVCPVDGELVHVEDGGDHQHAAPIRYGSPPRLAVGALERHDEHHGHEHCVVVATRKNLLGLRASAQGSLSPLLPSTVIDLATAATPGARVALHRVAPKQSPPT